MAKVTTSANKADKTKKPVKPTEMTGDAIDLVYENTRGDEVKAKVFLRAPKISTLKGKAIPSAAVELIIAGKKLPEDLAEYASVSRAECIETLAYMHKTGSGSIEVEEAKK